MIASIALGSVVDGCDARGGGGGAGIRSDGAADEDGGAAGKGNGGSNIACNPTASGCLCLVDDEEEGQLTACSPTSVAESERERGVCCVSQALCTCLRYTCRSAPESSFCQCASVYQLTDVVLGMQVAQCPSPTAEQSCCFSQDNGTCICSSLDCGEDELPVENCSADVAGACRPGEEIAACR